jgi:hypothetical protein
MKKIAILMIALIAVSLAVPMIAAQDTGEDLEVVDAGVTPDSPFYGLERAMERLRVSFTAGKAEKAKLKLRYAEERLAEAEQMADEGNEEALVEAQEAHDEEIEEVENLVEEIETDSSEDVAEEALEDVNNLRLGLLNHSERINFVHTRILDRLRENENVSDEQLAHLEEVFAKIYNKSLVMELKMIQRRENVRTKYKVLSNKTEEELNESEADFLEQIQEVKDRIQERENKRVEAVSNVVEALQERTQQRIQERMMDFNETEDEARAALVAQEEAHGRALEKAGTVKGVKSE